MNNRKTIQLSSLDKKTALRYLGYGDKEPDESMGGLLNRAEAALLAAIRPAYVFRVLSLVDGQLDAAPGLLSGNAIQEHLAGCERAVLLAATLSASVDTLLRQMPLREGMAAAMAADALASAAVEQVLDLAEEEILQLLAAVETTQLLAAEGTSQRLAAEPVFEHTFRYSPGYGDFPLEVQPRFLEVLDAPRRIGLTASPSLLLVPTKSVTCIFGIGENLPKERKKTCRDCTLEGKCSFRRRGTFCYRI